MENILQKILPPWVHRRLIGQWNKEGLKKYTKNTAWLFLGRVALYPISLITVASVARHLGPDGIGKLSYGQSIAGLVTTFASLGIDQVLVRELIHHPEKEKSILGTVFVTRMTTMIIAFIATVGISFYLSADTTLSWVIFFASSTMIIGPLSIPANAFPARALLKYTTIITITSGLIIALLKIAFVATDKPLIYFASLFLIESIILGILNIYFYKKIIGGSLRSWSFDSNILRQLLNDSWPLLISGTTVYIFMRIDQIMLMHFASAAEVGMYGSVVQLSDLWTFLPNLFISSLYPAIAGMYHRDHSEYRKRIRAVGILSFSVACAIGLVVIIFSPLIIRIIFGSSFLAATPILRLYTFYVPLSVIFTIVQSHMLTANKTHIMLLVGISGAIINVLLNVVLIPTHGAIGASIATIVATIIMIIIPFIHHQNRSGTAIIS